jgi:hypothetical protein
MFETPEVQESPINILKFIGWERDDSIGTISQAGRAKSATPQIKDDLETGYKSKTTSKLAYCKAPPEDDLETGYKSKMTSGTGIL